jgi:hypothetical protein
MPLRSGRLGGRASWRQLARRSAPVRRRPPPIRSSRIESNRIAADLNRLRGRLRRVTQWPTGCVRAAAGAVAAAGDCARQRAGARRVRMEVGATWHARIVARMRNAAGTHAPTAHVVLALSDAQADWSAPPPQYCSRRVSGWVGRRRTVGYTPWAVARLRCFVALYYCPVALQTHPCCVAATAHGVAPNAYCCR